MKWKNEECKKYLKIDFFLQKDGKQWKFATKTDLHFVPLQCVV